MTTITVKVGAVLRTFDRDRLHTAYLLRLDHPTDATAVMRRLETEHGIEHYEALRLTLGAAACVNDGIEP